jgi:hypothetical protein
LTIGEIGVFSRVLKTTKAKSGILFLEKAFPKTRVNENKTCMWDMKM